MMNFKTAGFPRFFMSLFIALAVVGTTVSSSVAMAEDDELLNILGAGGAGAKTKGGESRLMKTIQTVQGRVTAEQNIFVQFFDKGEFDKALYQWPAAFDSSAFAATPSGRALNALVLFKNGIQVTALEMLLAIDSPKKSTKIF